MRFKRLQKFMEDCYNADVTIPDGMLVVLDDFEQVVPEEQAAIGKCEYNHRIGQYSARIEITSKEILETGFKTVKK